MDRIQDSERVALFYNKKTVIFFYLNVFYYIKENQLNKYKESVKL
jgi:hypothetical protein